MENTIVGTTEATIDSGLARALHVALVNLVEATRQGEDTRTEIAQAEGVLDQSKELFGYWPPVPAATA